MNFWRQQKHIWLKKKKKKRDLGPFCLCNLFSRDSRLASFPAIKLDSETLGALCACSSPLWWNLESVDWSRCGNKKRRTHSKKRLSAERRHWITAGLCRVHCAEKWPRVFRRRKKTLFCQFPWPLILYSGVAKTTLAPWPFLSNTRSRRARLFITTTGTFTQLHNVRPPPEKRVRKITAVQFRSSESVLWCRPCEARLKQAGRKSVVCVEQRGRMWREATILLRVIIKTEILQQGWERQLIKGEIRKIDSFFNTFSF